MNDIYSKTNGKWPYVLDKPYVRFLVRDWPTIKHEYFSVEDDVLIVRAGYAWDGVSCFPDKKNWMVASLVHDVLIQACDEKLCEDKYRDIAHKEMKHILKMTSTRFWATVMYVGLRFGHRGYVRIRNKFLRRD